MIYRTNATYEAIFNLLSPHVELPARAERMEEKDMNGQPLSSLAFGYFSVLSLVSFMLSLIKC